MRHRWCRLVERRSAKSTRRASRPSLRGEWMRDHWHKRRGFVKAHVAVDVGTLEVLGVVVTDDKVGEQQRARRARRAGAGSRNSGDKSARRRRLRHAGQLRSADIVMASRQASGSPATRRCVVAVIRSLDRERSGSGTPSARMAGKSATQYGLRWMVEYVFSAVKRTLGSEVRSRRRDLMFSEVENKFWMWNAMRARIYSTNFNDGKREEGRRRRTGSNR